ncbi:MAG TPA: type II secretion system protein GspG [Longimicrobiaceae bacterium]|nr:type II secretion system protein GspG [Longimicrobiaceae bacterium]
MKRLFLFLLVVLIAVLVNPTMRSKAEPHLAFALDPLYEWMARSKLGDIASHVEAQVASGRGVPDPKGFGTFLEQRYLRDDAPFDPWGTPYYLKVERGTVRAASAGRDRRRGTPDDIVSRPVATHPR